MRVETNDIFKIKTLSQPSMAGDDIFFQENWVDEASNSYRSRIVHFDRRTRRQTPYGLDQAHDKAPALSPDGTLLAFIGLDAGKKPQVFTQAVRGGLAKALTAEPNGVGSFIWTADSQAIFYTTTTQPKQDSKLPQPVTVTKAQYKLNGAGLLPENVTHQLKKQRLTHKTGRLVYSNTDEFGFDAVAPDGKTVALSLDRKPDDATNFDTTAYLLDSTTGKLTTINAHKLAASFGVVAFSHDGAQALLLGNENKVPNVAQTHLWHYDLASKKLTDTTKTLDLELNGMVVGDVQQGLSGRAAAFVTTDYYLATAFDHGRFGLYAGGPDQAFAPLVTGDRQITDWAVSADGHTVIFTSSDLTHPSQLRVFDLVSEADTLLVDPNTHYQNTHTLVEPQHFTFDRAGYTLEGWYYGPATTTRGKHPAILYVHGGPQVGYGYTFFHEMQALASAGYGVICMNPRGGAGYGQKFEAAVIKHYGEGDFDDLMMGVDEAIKLDPHIDAARLYVTGGSYGGFMTNWVVGHTDRFKAAASCRSISNWLSFYGTSDIGYYFTPWELTGEWSGDTSNIDLLWQFSPLKYIDNVKTPTLILHGEEDLRCPIGQGEEFYTALKLHGVDTKMIRFPQSNHELSRSGLPNLRIARMAAIREWFDAHR